MKEGESKSERIKKWQRNNDKCKKKTGNIKKTVKIEWEQKLSMQAMPRTRHRMQPLLYGAQPGCTTIEAREWRGILKKCVLLREVADLDAWHQTTESTSMACLCFHVPSFARLSAKIEILFSFMTFLNHICTKCVILHANLEVVIDFFVCV